MDELVGYGMKDVRGHVDAALMMSVACQNGMKGLLGPWVQ